MTPTHSILDIINRALSEAFPGVIWTYPLYHEWEGELDSFQLRVSLLYSNKRWKMRIRVIDLDIKGRLFMAEGDWFESPGDAAESALVRLSDQWELIANMSNTVKRMWFKAKGEAVCPSNSTPSGRSWSDAHKLGKERVIYTLDQLERHLRDEIDNIDTNRFPTQTEVLRHELEATRGALKLLESDP